MLRRDGPDHEFRDAALYVMARAGEAVQHDAPTSLLESAMYLLGYTSRSAVIKVAAAGRASRRTGAAAPAPPRVAPASDGRPSTPLAPPSRSPPGHLSRDEALRRLRGLVGHDLREFARRHGVTVFSRGKLNKGWAGQTLERVLGLPVSSTGSPDGGDWELKVTSVTAAGPGRYVPKETLKITMIDESDVAANAFARSRLYRKLSRLVLCARLYHDERESRAPLVVIEAFDLDRTAAYQMVESDYEQIRAALKARRPLHSEMGRLIQPRTAGPGHGSDSRAFYARKEFVAAVLGLG